MLYYTKPLWTWISVSTIRVWGTNLGCGSPLHCARQTDWMPISFSTIQSSTVNIDKCCNLERQPSTSQRNSAVKPHCLNWNFTQLLTLTHACGIVKTMWRLSLRLNISIRVLWFIELCFINGLMFVETPVVVMRFIPFCWQLAVI